MSEALLELGADCSPAPSPFQNEMLIRCFTEKVAFGLAAAYIGLKIGGALALLFGGPFAWAVGLYEMGKLGFAITLMSVAAEELIECLDASSPAPTSAQYVGSAISHLALGLATRQAIHVTRRPRIAYVVV